MSKTVCSEAAEDIQHSVWTVPWLQSDPLLGSPKPCTERRTASRLIDGCICCRLIDGCICRGEGGTLLANGFVLCEKTWWSEAGVPWCKSWRCDAWESSGLWLRMAGERGSWARGRGLHQGSQCWWRAASVLQAGRQRFSTFTHFGKWRSEKDLSMKIRERSFQPPSGLPLWRLRLVI